MPAGELRPSTCGEAETGRRVGIHLLRPAGISILDENEAQGYAHHQACRELSAATIMSACSDIHVALSEYRGSSGVSRARNIKRNGAGEIENAGRLAMCCGVMTAVYCRWRYYAIHNLSLYHAETFAIKAEMLKGGILHAQKFFCGGKRPASAYVANASAHRAVASWPTGYREMFAKFTARASSPSSAPRREASSC